MALYKLENLNPDSVFVPALMGIMISGLWIAYKLNVFKLIPRINDERGILIPSVVFLLSPFLTVYIYSNFGNRIIEESRVIVPLFTFILGQALARNEKWQDLDKRTRDVAREIANRLKNRVIEPLQRIEGVLKVYKNSKGDREDLIEKVKMLCERYESTLEDEYEYFCAKSDFLENKTTQKSIEFFERTKSVLENYREEFERKFPETALEMLIEIRSLQVQGYCNLIELNKDLLQNEDELKALIYWLKRSYKIFIASKGIRDNKIQLWRQISLDVRVNQQEPSLDIIHDIDTEESMIQDIKQALLKFGVNPSEL